MENKSYNDVIRSPAAPYINELAAECGLATNFSAEAHPSLPNYIAMTSGSTQGISDDGGPASHPLASASIFAQLGPAGWRALEESMPAPCALSDSGSYAVRHNPAAYYMRIRAMCETRDVPLTSPPDLSARFTFVTPNLCNDMHDCSVSTGDTWLRSWLQPFFASRQYRSGSTAIFLTWDEDDYQSEQHIPTLVIAPAVPRGLRVPRAFNHYSLLRTTEELLGLRRYLGSAARANSMRALFRL